MAMHLRIVDASNDHFVVYTDEPCRIEVSLIPEGEPNIIMHAYHGLNLDLQQEPDLTYDGTVRHDMVDMDARS